MKSAARSPIGPNRVTAITKLRDMLIVIAAPFIVPAVALALARPGHAFTLGDVAFGFVSMAIAGAARATVVKSDEWMTFAFGAMIIVVVQTALAISVDNVFESQLLLHKLAAATPTDVVHELAELRQLVDSIQGKDPTLFDWTASLLSGGLITVISFELIRRER